MTSAPQQERRPHPLPNAVATALAHAFLASESWGPSELAALGARVLGGRRRWLETLVAEMLGRFPRPPQDSSRELAAFIAHAKPFRRAVARGAKVRLPLRVHEHIVTPAHARPPAGALPRLDSVADLAALLGLSTGQLEWYADTKNWGRRTSAGRLQNYSYEWRVRAGRAPRLLEVPTQRLRRVQRALLQGVLGPIPLNDAAHGFVPGRSALSGASLHVGSELVIALDLVTFFTRVEARRVYGVARQAGIPEALAHLITGVCTNAVPPRVIAAMPPVGDPDERFALRQALRTPHLPQGAPSSPTLANLAVRRLDSRLSGWARASGAAYTRYADDLTFSAQSGESAVVKRADAFIRGVHRIVAEEGHEINVRKTRVRRASVRQSVTGIVVNRHTNFVRRDYDQLKATLHNCVATGPAAQNWAGHPDFRAHLQGRVAWVESLNSRRGLALREKLALIEWE